MATSKSSTPASGPTLRDHVMEHAVVPIFKEVARYAATGVTPGASSATLASTSTASPRLGLSKDKKFTIDGWWHFSALITHISDENGHGINLDDHEDFSDARLAGIAAEGHRDMISVLKASNAPRDVWPFAMTALIAGGELYLSSSIKKDGRGFRRLFPKSPVADALERCSQVTAPLAANKRARKLVTCTAQPATVANPEPCSCITCDMVGNHGRGNRVSVVTRCQTRPELSLGMAETSCHHVKKIQEIQENLCQSKILSTAEWYCHPWIQNGHPRIYNGVVRGSPRS